MGLKFRKFLQILAICENKYFNEKFAILADFTPTTGEFMKFEMFKTAIFKNLDLEKNKLYTVFKFLIDDTPIIQSTCDHDFGFFNQQNRLGFS